MKTVVSNRAFVAGLALVTFLGAGMLAAPVRSLQLFQWDESRLAMNALEMLQSGDWLVTRFLGAPDMWSTKPPLMIWAMAASMKLFGASDVAARLPAALATIASVALVFCFCRRVLGDVRTGLFSALVLLGSFGFFSPHVGSTADYDVLLALFVSVAAGAFFLQSHTDDARWLLVAALALAGGVLTKGVAALMILPALGLFALLRGRLRALLTERLFYASLLLFVGLVALFYLLREQRNPGYLRAVLVNEITGRFLEVNEGHAAPATFYLRNLWHGRWGGFVGGFAEDARFLPWAPLLPVGLLLGWRSRDRATRWLALFLSTYVGGYLAVITVSKTKLYWYDAPFYPAAAILCGLALRELIRLAGERIPVQHVLLRRAGLALVVLVVFVPPIVAVAGRIARYPGQEHHRAYVESLRRAHPELVQFESISQHVSTPLLFYIAAARYEAERTATTPAPSVGQGRAVISCQPAQIAALRQEPHVTVLHAEGDCATLLLASAGRPLESATQQAP